MLTSILTGDEFTGVRPKPDIASSSRPGSIHRKLLEITRLPFSSDFVETNQTARELTGWATRIRWWISLKDMTPQQMKAAIDF
jgi:hypothetical protein